LTYSTDSLKQETDRLFDLSKKEVNQVRYLEKTAITKRFISGNASSWSSIQNDPDFKEMRRVGFSA
jgi:hypothetical protein